MVTNQLLARWLRRKGLRADALAVGERECVAVWRYWWVRHPVTTAVRLPGGGWAWGDTVSGGNLDGTGFQYVTSESDDVNVIGSQLMTTLRLGAGS